MLLEKPGLKIGYADGPDLVHILGQTETVLSQKIYYSSTKHFCQISFVSDPKANYREKFK